MLFHKAKLCICIYIFMIRATYQAISTIRPQNPSPISYAFYTPQAISSHVATLAGFTSYDAQFIMYAPNMSIWYMINITGLAYDNTAQIRTGAFNSFSNFSASTILYFTSNTLKLISPFTLAISNLPIAPGYSLIDCCFGTNKTTIYTVMQDTMIQTYSLFIYNGTAVASSTSLNYINPNVDELDQLFFDGDRLFLVLSSRLVVYNCVGLSLGTVIVAITYGAEQLEYIDARVQLDLLVYSVGVNLYLYNLTSLSPIRTFTSTNPIESITKTSNNYIILKTFSTFQQYDMDLNQVIHTITTGLTLQKIQALQNGQFISWQDQGTYMMNLQILGTTADYPPNNFTCLQTYILSGTSCTKNPNATITPTPTNLTATNSTMNSTLNLTTPNVSINSNINVQPNINTNVINVPSQKTQTTYTQATDKYLSIFTVSTTSYIFSAATLKIMPKFLLVFTLLVNDLALYRYHKKFQPAYPKSTLIFMEKFDMLKELGIQSMENYFPFLNPNNEQLQEANAHTLARLQFTEHDPQQVYFLYALTDFGLSCLLLNTLYFLVLKVTHLLLYKLRHQHLALRKCYLFIRNQSKWWVLLVAILEMNFTDLVLAVSLQLLQPVSLCFFDKLNLAAMLLAFFVAVFYALAFYGLVYASQKRRSSRTLIVYCKQRQMASYFFEPALVLVRSVSKAFTHGFLLCSYSAQIVSLLLLDVFFLVLCLSRVRSFRNKPIACLLTAYFLGFLLFDLFFVAEIHTDVTDKWDRELIGFIICCSMAGISLLMCLVFIVSSLFASYKYIKNRCIKRIFSSNQQQNLAAGIQGQQTFPKIRSINNETIGLKKIENVKQAHYRNERIDTPKIIMSEKTRKRYKIHAQKRKKSMQKIRIWFEQNQKGSQIIHGIVEIKLKDGRERFKK